MIDRDGRSELHQAAFVGDADRVALLAEEGLNVDLPDRDGFTPLHLAAQEWNANAARALLDHGASVDSVNRYGNTPLFVAVFNSRGRGELISILREFGADPFKENNHGRSPLGLARLIGNYDVAQYFADL
ncbi:ankyrin repeat domain-containing protein [Nonomuraea sp. MCN248]|uniref:Ankyrin repeat domain-containing protein n=1 Tax=Nonomuraea corallina TaxID=2989783 RepID=A0ABT4S5P5_9ACTN|nr:ankyrin repeat domain-containing protein [Nonomuraea corallina]MDA0632517.1 ankyrin repeat domain-containing protein [Nonomuraea corallina]